MNALGKIAFAFAAAGVVIGAVGAAQQAHADTAPYTLVAWEITAGHGHELDADQTFITALPGATSLDALDSYLALNNCGQYVQLDYYRSTVNGVPVSSLWADGVLHPNRDGGFLAYNVMAKPYDTKDIPACQTTVPTSSPTPSASPSPTDEPSASPTTTPSVSPAPSSTPVMITSTPAPSESCVDGKTVVTIPPGNEKYWWYPKVHDVPTPVESVTVETQDGYVFAPTVRRDWVFHVPGTSCDASAPPIAPTPTAETTPPAPSATPTQQPSRQLTPSPSSAATTAPVVDATTPTATKLAYTGSDSHPLIVGGLVAVGLGALLWFVDLKVRTGRIRRERR